MGKVLWMRRIRVLRRLLKKYRDDDKIDKHTYHMLYRQCKGGKYKTKRNLVETIHKLKGERMREKQIADQAQARKEKARARVARREAKKAEKLGSGAAEPAMKAEKSTKK